MLGNRWLCNNTLKAVNICMNRSWVRLAPTLAKFKLMVDFFSLCMRLQ